MRNRYLDEYIDEVSPVIESQCVRDEGVERSLEREQPTIRVIAGGPTLAGDSNRARKNYELWEIHHDQQRSAFQFAIGQEGESEASSHYMDR